MGLRFNIMNKPEISIAETRKMAIAQKICALVVSSTLNQSFQLQYLYYLLSFAIVAIH